MKKSLAIAYATQKAANKKAYGGMMYAQGGQVNEKLHPGHKEPMSPHAAIAMAILKKKDPNYAKGGMVDCYSDGGMAEEDDYSQEENDMFSPDAGQGIHYASEGGMMEMPDSQMEMAGEPEEDVKKKAMMHQVMAKIRMRHMGK